ACMAYMAQPSFLVAPDSSGPQFYSVRPFTRNPLNQPTEPPEPSERFLCLNLVGSTSTKHLAAVEILTREVAMAESGTGPGVTGYHHFAPTVSHVEASAEWYARVFGMTRVPVAFPHHGGEQGGYAVVLTDPRSGIVLGLHHHDANPSQAFDERRTGLDHMAFAV